MAAKAKARKLPARRCKGRTKAGKACRAVALKGHDVCMAHAPEEIREKARFGKAQLGAGRPPKPKATDVLRERVEAKIDEVLTPLFDALKAERVAGWDNGEPLSVPDHQIRLRGAELILDRVYGKPRQTVDGSAAGRAIPDAQVIAELAGLDDGSGGVVARVGVAFGRGASDQDNVVEGTARRR